MEKNGQLMQENSSVVKDYQQAKYDIRDVEAKNETLRQLLKERHGRNEQQMRIDELKEQAKVKEKDLNGLQKQLLEMQQEDSHVVQVIALRKLKASEIQLHLKVEASQDKTISVLKERTALDNDEEFNQLKDKLQLEKDQEELLEKQLEELKADPKALALPQPPDEGQIKALQEKIKSLQAQKEGLQKQSNVDNNQTKFKRYNQLLTKKKELEDKIQEFEAQLNSFKDPQVLGLWDPKQKKQILHEMIRVDNENIQLRHKISNLGEDVSLLKVQVSRLERKANLAHGSLEHK